MTTRSIETATHCAHCGLPISGNVEAPERFSERFCSQQHADEFVAGVRTTRMEAAASPEALVSKRADHAGACALPPAGQRSWRDYLKRGACWGAPLLILIAIPLFWSGGWGATGGTLLTAIAFLACPLGLYFMMRGMMMNQPGGSESQRDARGKEDRHSGSVPIVSEVDPTNPKVMYVAMRGGVFQPGTGGARWTSASGSPRNAAAVTVKPKRPSELYAVTAEGRIFVSCDRGQGWEPVA